MGANANLHKAKDAKNDEFYTQLSDVSEELRHYKEHFRGKIVFCNCDDPTWSAFWKYFHLNFEVLGLKKLISTHYDRHEATYKMEYEGGDDNDIEAGVKTPLEGNGDFRNKECLDLLDECDIVVTNPPFSCYSSDTEVMTNHGWKLFKDVDITNDLIMSLNPETKQAEMVKAVDFLCTPYKGKMYSFHNRSMDFYVTPNHKMYACHSIEYNNRPKGEYRVLITEPFRNAENVKKSTLLPISGFTWTGEKEEFFYLPATKQVEQYSRKEVEIPEKKIRMKDWLEFFGFYLADGCFRDHINTYGKRDYTVSIAQNEENEEYVLDLISRIGFPCNIGDKGGNRNNVCKNYNIYSKQLWEYLEQFGRSQDKYIPEAFMNLDTEYLEALLKGYSNGDCGKCADGSFHYSSTSKRLMENVQQLILRIHGIMAQILKTTKKHSYDNRYGTCYHINVHIGRGHGKYTKYGTPKLIDYCDNVYCLTLERNHIMLVRHNGVIGWCGNCFREYTATLMEHKKKFVILGNPNAVTYKEFFPLLKDNEVWVGAKPWSKEMYFGVPKEQEEWLVKNKKEGSAYVVIDGKVLGRVATIWFTNLDIKKRHENLILWKKYNPEEYPRYDNYLAWNVDKVCEIPCDEYIDVEISESELEAYRSVYPDLEVLSDD